MSSVVNATVEEMRALLALERARAEEQRAKIASKMHNDLSQRLTVLTLELAMLQTKVMGGEGISGLSKLLEQVVSLNKSVRQITTELRPKVLDQFGLVAALQAECRGMNSEAGVKVGIASDLPDISLHPQNANEVFRLFQAMVAILVIHLRATEITVEISQANGTFCLAVSGPNGIVPQNTWKESSALELLGVQERAAWIGGNIRIHESSSPRSKIEIQFLAEINVLTSLPTRSRAHIG